MIDFLILPPYKLYAVVIISECISIDIHGTNVFLTSF